MIHLNFKGMNFQVSIKDIENFEKQNPNLLGINVFTNKGTSIVPLRISGKDCKKRVLICF